MTSVARPRVLCLPTGPDEYAVAIVRALAEHADVDFVLPVAMLERYRADLPTSVRVHPVQWPRHRDPRNLWLLAVLARIIRATAPDVVHFLGDSVFWLVLALPMLRHTPIVVTVHDVRYHPGDSQSRTVPMATIGLLRRAADAIIVHGEALRRDLQATGIAPPCDVHVVPHPVLDRHTRLARRLGLARQSVAERPTVLFFGRIMAYKGLGLLIEASDRVVAACPGTRFIVAGCGPDLAHWRHALHQRPWFEVRDRYVPDAEAAQLFLDADVVALPYTEASQSGVVAMAVASRLPVVATSVGELGALVAAGDLGVVAAPDSADIARALVTVLADPQRRARYATNAMSIAQTELSAERIAQSTIAVYMRTARPEACFGSPRFTLQAK